MANCLTLKKSNCKNCYKCIRHCPVKAIRFSANQAHIIGNECILCGQCFVVCPQNAKEIVDSTEKVRVLLQTGDPVVVSLAPSFIANYEGIGIASMRRALQKLGFAGVEETALGATIVKNEYERMLREESRDIIIHLNRNTNAITLPYTKTAGECNLVFQVILFYSRLQKFYNIGRAFQIARTAYTNLNDHMITPSL